MPTDTAHVRIESRQYRVFNFDLGEGIPRATMKVGLLFFAPWFALCWIVGLPLLGGLVFWIAPPSVVTLRALSRDAGGRLRLRGWIDRVLWWLRGSRAIVNADTTSGREPRPFRVEAPFVVVDLDGRRRLARGEPRRG